MEQNRETASLYHGGQKDKAVEKGIREAGNKSTIKYNSKGE